MVRVLREREIKQNNREIKELREKVAKKTNEIDKCKVAIELAKDERNDIEFYIDNTKKSLEEMDPGSSEAADTNLLLAKHKKRHAELEDMIFDNRTDIGILDEEIDEAKTVIRVLRQENAI